MSVPNSNRVTPSGSVKSFDSSWKKDAASVIYDDDAKTTSSMCANFSFALEEDLEKGVKCELLSGFTPDKLIQPFDPEHVCNVFLKCRILLNDYIKTLDDDRSGSKTKLLPNVRSKQINESKPRSRQLGISRGRGLLSGSVTDLRENNFAPALNSTAIVSSDAVEDSIVINANNTKYEPFENEQSTMKQESQKPEAKKEDLNFAEKNENSKTVNHAEPIEPLENLQKTQDLPLFESKYNFKYRDIYYRLIIQNDKTVADMKRKISYTINLNVDRIGLSFSDAQPDKEITDKIDIVTFNKTYKYLFYVFDVNDFNAEKTNENNQFKNTEEPKRTTEKRSPHAIKSVMEENHKMKSELETLKEENERLKSHISMINSENYSVDNKSMASFNSSYRSFRSMQSRPKHHQ